MAAMRAPSRLTTLPLACEHHATIYARCSARLGDPVPETDVANSPHRPPSRRVLAVDVRVERHVHILVKYIDDRRAPGSSRAKFPTIHTPEVSKYYGLGKDDDDAYVTRNGALGAPTFLNGPVTLRETAYEMSYLRVLYTFDEKNK